MTIWIACAVFGAVHVFSVYVLRSSGTWAVLFAPALQLAERDPDPLTESPRGWIENHEFWELSESEAPAHETPETAFWGGEVGESAS
jgi:hypothetical protein